MNDQRGGHRAALSAVLFIALGLVGAFLVSAIVGTRSGDATFHATASDARSDDGDARTLPAATLVRIEVLNGAGAPGLARLATSRLRSDGFDVVFFGNAERFDHPRSVVLDRTGDLARARMVAAALGIDSVATVPDHDLLLDVSVILGADWPTPPPPTTPLDRLRRLFAPADTAP